MERIIQDMAETIYRVVKGTVGGFEILGPEEHQRGAVTVGIAGLRAAELLASELEVAYWVGRLHGVQEAAQRAFDALGSGVTKAQVEGDGQ